MSIRYQNQIVAITYQLSLVPAIIVLNDILFEKRFIM